MSLFVPASEIPSADLRDLVGRSYSTFRHPNTTPLHPISDKEYVLELFHGPTFAFKDVALQFLGNLFEFFLKRRNAAKQAGNEREKLTIVGATSGDTGSCVPLSPSPPPARGAGCASAAPCGLALASGRLTCATRHPVPFRPRAGPPSTVSVARPTSRSSCCSRPAASRPSRRRR